MDIAEGDQVLDIGCGTGKSTRSVRGERLGFGMGIDLSSRMLDRFQVLHDAGFADERITPVTEPVWLGADEEDAWSFVSNMGIVRGLIDGLEPQARQEASDELRGTMAAHETDEGVLFDSAAWLVNARRS